MAPPAFTTGTGGRGMTSVGPSDATGWANPLVPRSVLGSGSARSRSRIGDSSAGSAGIRTNASRSRSYRDTSTMPDGAPGASETTKIWRTRAGCGAVVNHRWKCPTESNAVTVGEGPRSACSQKYARVSSRSNSCVNWPTCVRKLVCMR